eukprot:281271-Rhodomonas_salina.2
MMPKNHHRRRHHFHHNFRHHRHHQQHRENEVCGCRSGAAAAGAGHGDARSDDALRVPAPRS